jgi:lipoate-protein ligase A
MILVDNQGVSEPQLNLALEEYLLRQSEIAEPILLLYTNRPSVIVGRNQNILEETDPSYLQQHEIPVIRRLSGGGAVYHDWGNLNYSFITTGKEDLHNFQKVTAPVVRLLGELGLSVELRDRSSLFVGNQKISGNAQYATGDRLLSHGTLLFETDLEDLSRALKPHSDGIQSKAVQSVRSAVANIRDLLDVNMTMAEFTSFVLSHISAGEAIQTTWLSPTEWNQIRNITTDRFQSWDWNYGRSPNFTIQKSGQVPEGRLETNITVVKGRIQNANFYIDGQVLPNTASPSRRLAGTRYDKDSLTQALTEIDLGAYFGEVEPGDFVKLLY